MAISNIHETLLLYAKQKALINDKLSTTIMNMLSSTKKTAETQAKYNEQMNDIYYNYYESDPETYELLTEQYNRQHEYLTESREKEDVAYLTQLKKEYGLD